MRNLFKNLVLVLSLSVVSLVLSACGNGEPKDVAVTFVKNLYSGNSEKVIDALIFPEEFEKDENAKNIMSGIIGMLVAEASKKAESLGGVKEIKCLEENVTEDRAKVKVQVTFNNEGQEQIEIVHLEKVKNKWKVVK